MALGGLGRLGVGFVRGVERDGGGGLVRILGLTGLRGHHARCMIW